MKVYVSVFVHKETGVPMPYAHGLNDDVAFGVGKCALDSAPEYKRISAPHLVEINIDDNQE